MDVEMDPIEGVKHKCYDIDAPGCINGSVD